MLNKFGNAPFIIVEDGGGGGYYPPILQNTQPATLANCSCLIGTPYIENGVCKCNNNETVNTLNDCGCHSNTAGDCGCHNTPTATGAGSNDLVAQAKQFAKDNPLVALGGVAFLIYLITKK